jgi:hypothetical protein
MRNQRKFWQGLGVLLIIGLLCLTAALAQADARSIKPLKEWRGRVASIPPKGAPARPYLVNQAELDKLWSVWHLPGKSPEVDFKTRQVLLGSCTCSHISITPLLNEQGDLHIQVTTTKDITNDVGYHIILIPRRGIRTIDGKPL